MLLFTVPQTSHGPVDEHKIPRKCESLEIVEEPEN